MSAVRSPLEIAWNNSTLEALETSLLFEGRGWGEMKGSRLEHLLSAMNRQARMGLSVPEHMVAILIERPSRSRRAASKPRQSAVSVSFSNISSRELSGSLDLSIPSFILIPASPGRFVARADLVTWPS